MPFPSSFWIFHFVYSWCICVCAKPCPTLLWPKGLQPTRLLCPWNFPGKNIGKGFHFLFQGIFQTQGSHSHLLHWQVDSLPLSHQGSPKKLSTLHHYLVKMTGRNLQLNSETSISYWTVSLKGVNLFIRSLHKVNMTLACHKDKMNVAILTRHAQKCHFYM